MLRVLVTAYDVDPYRGSESGMGWHFIDQAAWRHSVVAVTRENNRGAIERYLKEKGPRRENLTFLYFDLPKVLRFWKRGPRGALAYFYLWQLFVPLFVKIRGVRFDIAHNLNFHTDWVPSFLWTLGKPLVWGPVGHHPKVPRAFLKPYGFRALLADRARWAVKSLSWRLDPFLRICAKKASAILCMNSEADRALRPEPAKAYRMPSVGSDDHGWVGPATGGGFTALCVGRFVPLKGFDVAIRAFARTLGALPAEEREKFRIVLVGRGPAEPLLRGLCRELGLGGSVEWIDWVERSALPAVYRRASVFLFPSHEGAGMVVAEAFSHGLPVLCFDNAGPGEFVDDSCGRKIAYRGGYSSAVDDFARALLELYHDPVLRERLARGARARFEAAFDWPVKGEMLDEIYRRVMERCESSFAFTS